MREVVSTTNVCAFNIDTEKINATSAIEVRQIIFFIVQGFMVFDRFERQSGKIYPESNGNS